MKKIVDISTSILLSALIIYMSVGIAMVHCSHKENAMNMAQVDASSNSDSDCNMPMKNCMTVKVTKLSPTSVAQALHYDFNVFQPLLFINDCSLILPRQAYHLINQQIAETHPHGPPRAYLSFIRVLII